MKKINLLFLFVVVFSINNFAQVAGKDSSISKNLGNEKKWFEKISIRGYMQVRYNRLLETNENLNCEQCDKSIGNNGGFFMRRMRVIIYGQVHPQVYFYVQPDFASSASSTGLHFGQLRDAYVDVGVDPHNEFRFRIGQSKVPYGFENMQSSQNRLPLDRSDALNSSHSNERDLGVFFYYTPKKFRKLYSNLVNEGYKGSGDYGVFALGAYNGQLANKSEQNNTPHIVSRLSYPFELKNQVLELGIQAYYGKYILTSDQLSTGVKYKSDKSYSDERIAATLNLAPKPFGILAEYNVGQGPEYNSVTDSIENRSLSGGFITLSYMHKHKGMTIMPFTRFQLYEGGKKQELDARSYSVKEVEMGIEWQFNKNFELVTAYTISDRRFEDFKKQSNLQKGNFLRLQAQVNF